MFARINSAIRRYRERQKKRSRLYRYTNRLVAVIGLLSPLLPVVGHYVALWLGPTDVWAPTMAGDLIGMAAAVAAALVTVVAALASAERRAT